MAMIGGFSRLVGACRITQMVSEFWTQHPFDQRLLELNAIDRSLTAVAGIDPVVSSNVILSHVGKVKLTQWLSVTCPVVIE